MTTTERNTMPSEFSSCGCFYKHLGDCPPDEILTQAAREIARGNRDVVTTLCTLYRNLSRRDAAEYARRAAALGWSTKASY